MKWADILKNEPPAPVNLGGMGTNNNRNVQELDEIINTHKKMFGNGEWFGRFAWDLAQLKELMLTDPKGAAAKWKEMKGVRLDIEGTFEAIKEMYQQIDRIFSRT